MNTKNLDLYIVDDDEHVRRALLLKLGLRSNKVQAFASGEAFLAGANLQGGGCVILDQRMPGMSGEQVFDELQERKSPLVVLFLSGHGTIPQAVGATKRGAVDWVEKPFSETGAVDWVEKPFNDTLMEKIDGALEKAAEVAAKHQSRQLARADWDDLTKREKEVARLMAQGLVNKLIARELKCGVRVIETYRAKVRLKLGLSSPPEIDRFIRDNAL